MSIFDTIDTMCAGPPMVMLFNVPIQCMLVIDGFQGLGQAYLNRIPSLGPIPKHLGLWPPLYLVGCFCGDFMKFPWEVT